MTEKNENKFIMGVPRLCRRQEIETAVVYAVSITSLALVMLTLSVTGAAEGTDGRLMIDLALGLILVSAAASCFAFLIVLRHRLLLLTAAAAITTAGAIFLGFTPLESVAKVVFAVSAGLWISLMLSSRGQVLLIAVLIIAVDFYSVYFGPTKKLVESGGPWLDFFTISLPVFGEDTVSRLGISDIIFFSLFLGSALIYNFRRRLSALAMSASFVATMIIGIMLENGTFELPWRSDIHGVPALPLLSLFFLAVNADLFIKWLLPGRAGGNNNMVSR